VKKREERRLTTADLVLLSLLAEKPMHGYQANAELARREIRDWAAISRPQVYYSLEKLARLGYLRAVAPRSGSAGWCTARERPPFLTWMALSWQARRGIFGRQLERRREFLKRELLRERETLESVLDEVGHPYHEAVWMVTLMIRQFETELRWIAQLQKEMTRREPARHPALL